MRDLAWLSGQLQGGLRTEMIDGVECYVLGSLVQPVARGVVAAAATRCPHCGALLGLQERRRGLCDDCQIAALRAA